VVRGGPGDRAGLRRLDVITAVNGQKIRNGAELVAAISSHRAGETVKVTVFRGGSSYDFKAVLGDRQELLNRSDQDEGQDDEEPPQNSPQDGRTVDLLKSYGFSVEALTPLNQHQYGIGRDWRGVVVTAVSPRSAAGDKGLQPGLVISAVGTRDIDGIQDFYQEVKKVGGRKPLLILVRVPRSGAQATLAIPHR